MTDVSIACNDNIDAGEDVFIEGSQGFDFHYTMELILCN